MDLLDHLFHLPENDGLYSFAYLLIFFVLATFECSCGFYSFPWEKILIGKVNSCDKSTGLVLGRSWLNY